MVAAFLERDGASIFCTKKKVLPLFLLVFFLFFIFSSYFYCEHGGYSDTSIVFSL